MVQISDMEGAVIDYRSLLLLSVVLFVGMLMLNRQILNQKYNGLIKLFVFIFLVRVIIDPITDSGNINSKIVSALQALLLPAFLLFFYSISQKFDVKKIFSYFSFLLLIALSCTYFYIFFFRNEFAYLNVFASLNSSYYLLLLLPCALIDSSKPVYKLIAIILVSLIVFSSMKRGGIIALILGLILYYVVKKFCIRRNSVRTGRLLFSVISIVLIVAIMIFALIQFDAIAGGFMSSRFESIADDEGSGRLGLYREVIDKIQDFDLLPFLFGHGKLAVAKVTSYGLSAHNDFLEILYDYGFLLFICYVVFHFCLIFKISKLIRLKSVYAPVMVMSYVNFFIFSMVSHVFLFSYFLFSLMLWGFILGTIKRESSYASSK